MPGWRSNTSATSSRLFLLAGDEHRARAVQPQELALEVVEREADALVAELDARSAPASPTMPPHSVPSRSTATTLRARPW